MAFQPRHAVLTGAAGAIGGELSRVLVEKYSQLRLNLVDKDAAGLQARCRELGPQAVARPWDLSAPSTLPELWQQVQAGGPVDLLINCAGFMEIRSFQATPWELGERLINVDLISPLRLMQLAVVDMPAGGRIVNISSMAGRVPMRGYSYYGAAKSGLGVASEIAAVDLDERGISVLTVYPGPVRSPLEARGRTQLRKSPIAEHAPTGNPAALARRIARALERGHKRLVYPTIYAVPDLFIEIGRAHV